MTTTEKQFVQIMRSAIDKSTPPQNCDWYAIWNFACRHHLEVMVYEVAKNDSSLPNDLRTQMHTTYCLMAAREVRQTHYAEYVRNTLDKAGIHYAILKGGILKADYPKPFTRYMSDIDFYIKPDDRNYIKTVMKSIDGVYTGTDAGDESFSLNNQVGVEFHGRLLYRRNGIRIENYFDWSFVDEENNRLNEEGYALNLIGHVVHDLANGGPGIRYILDLWVYRNCHRPQPDWKMVNDRFKADGIYDVAKNLLDLSEFLFGDGIETDLMNEMASYVLQGGLHGDFNRTIAIEARAGKKEAIVRQVFRDRTEFENRYPWVRKHPILLPLAWIVRMIQGLKNHKFIIIRWVNGINNVSRTSVQDYKEILDRFGL